MIDDANPSQHMSHPIRQDITNGSVGCCGQFRMLISDPIQMATTRLTSPHRIVADIGVVTSRRLAANKAGQEEEPPKRTNISNPMVATALINSVTAAASWREGIAAARCAATMLLALGVTERAAMGVMGWSSTVDGCEMPAHDRSDPARHREVAWRTALDGLGVWQILVG